jgi:hypothetical protein
MLPEEIAVVQVLGHQWGNALEAQGNNLTDKAAKEATLHPELQMLHLTRIMQAPSVNPIFTLLERVQLEKLGASQTPEGR